jgi:hypothetical protein
MLMKSNPGGKTSAINGRCPTPRLCLAEASGKSDGALTCMSVYARFPLPRCTHVWRARAWLFIGGFRLWGCRPYGRSFMRCSPHQIRPSDTNIWMAALGRRISDGTARNGPGRDVGSRSDADPARSERQALHGRSGITPKIGGLGSGDKPIGDSLPDSRIW